MSDAPEAAPSRFAPRPLPGVGRLLDQAVGWAPPLRYLLTEARKAVRKWRWRRMGATGLRVLDPEALRGKFREALDWVARDGADKVGDYLELGVFNGTSIIEMNKALSAANLNHVRMFGFDSFEGMPDSVSEEGSANWEPGMYATTLETVRRRLNEGGVPEARSFLIKGFFDKTCTPETVARYKMGRASVIMIDVEQYTAARPALEFAAQFITDEAVVIMGAWYTPVPYEIGAQRAYGEFMAAHPEFQAADFGSYAGFDRQAGHAYKLTRRAQA
ncbi:MAG: hypothetical protein JNJ73_04155 [Hyphomonadaceae bacterium]|nr:hypothetical protein [Hyphomonadaceae bacterium]